MTTIIVDESFFLRNIQFAHEVGFWNWLQESARLPMAGRLIEGTELAPNYFPCSERYPDLLGYIFVQE